MPMPGPTCQVLWKLNAKTQMSCADRAVQTLLPHYYFFFFLLFYNSCSNSGLCSRTSSYAQNSTPHPTKHLHRQTPVPSSPTQEAIYTPVSTNSMPGATQVWAPMCSPFNKAGACCYKGMSFCSNQTVLVQTLPKH